MKLPNEVQSNEQCNGKDSLVKGLGFNSSCATIFLPYTPSVFFTLSYFFFEKRRKSMSYTGLLASVAGRIESACMQMVENTGRRMEDFACRLGRPMAGLHGCMRGRNRDTLINRWREKPMH